MNTYIPEGYKSLLGVYDTQKAIGLLKRLFEDQLAANLNLFRVSAPLFLEESSGLNGKEAQVVQSLAKWKRMALYRYDFYPGKGLYTDMNAIRRDEDVLDNLHSVYVDQWDWEKVIERRDRNLDYLKSTVMDIVAAVCETQRTMCAIYPQLQVLPQLERQVTFVTAQELEDKLFGCGFEVEELIDLGGEISKVVVGVVTECVPQEGTHLHICKVDCGEYGHDIQISTGAPNVYAGMHTAAALDGSTLPGGVKIKAKPLMGVESNGMLCSGEELGLNEDLYPGAEVYGLLDLPKDTVPGTPIQQVVGLDDYIFDISITANRADCQSVLGIAREVAAALNKPLKMPATDYTVSDYVDPRLSISVEAEDLCPRYIGHYVRNITPGESPRWMRRQLALCGLRSISNVVDITNYVMLEIGQPMHAFDMDTLESCQILVRRAKDGEKITTLDEKEFTLTPNNLVICDGSKPVALAGVMGGLNSEIKDTTTQLLFASARTPMPPAITRRVSPSTPPSLAWPVPCT